MSRPGSELEDEFELEFEGEFEAEGEGEFEAEDEWEDEFEDEAFLSTIGGLARGIGGLLGEGEDEYEDEGEDEGEFEDEQFLGALGGIARGISGLLGEGEDEAEWEDEDEAEEFFKRIGRALKKATPFLKVLAKTAGPLVATAIGGPAAGALARAVTRQLEAETEAELEAEFEEMATAPLAGTQAFGEYLAAQAASTESEAEAEALAGAAALASVRSSDLRDLERMLPALLRGAATITRLLHNDRRTRPAIRMVPGIVDAASRTLSHRIDDGQPVGPVEVGQVLGTTTRRVLSGGAAGSAVMRRHARGLAHAHRHRYGRRHHRGYRYGGQRSGYRGSGYRGARRQGPAVIARRPVRTTTVGSAGGRISRPQPGFVRVVTPVRVPATQQKPARTVRVVSDVRVPRGAVTAGRPVTVSGARRR